MLTSILVLQGWWRKYRYLILKTRQKLKREITDPDEVRYSDVILDGVEYTPGKAWEEKLGHWLRDGFRRVEPLRRCVKI